MGSELLQHVGSSSLTWDGTWTPCIGSWVLGTWPPGKSLSEMLHTERMLPPKFMLGKQTLRGCFWSNIWPTMDSGYDPSCHTVPDKTEEDWVSLVSLSGPSDQPGVKAQIELTISRMMLLLRLLYGLWDCHISLVSWAPSTSHTKNELVKQDGHCDYRTQNLEPGM